MLPQNYRPCGFRAVSAHSIPKSGCSSLSRHHSGSRLGTRITHRLLAERSCSTPPANERYLKWVLRKAANRYAPKAAR
jgi:hypothetical protein